MAFRHTLLAATILALPVAVAQAQPISGLYVGAGAGINFAMDSDIEGSKALSEPRKGDVQFDYGWGALVSIGWGFGNGVRAEVEASYRENAVNAASGFGLAGASHVGQVSTIGVMANVLYDFDLGPGVPLTPYVGLGAGAAFMDYESVRLISGPDRSNAVGSKMNFAFQGILGAAFRLDELTPGLALTAEYRFFGTLASDIDVAIVRGGTVTNGTGEVTNYNHSVMLGIRYAFNAAPPPPVATAGATAAAPAPARIFLVFFDFDRADLTDRARAIIAEAATNVQRTGSTRIEVAGHADRAGTPQYNQALSERRAQAVAAELERRGIARSAMTIQAFGESRPLVPTADGVREPQNRRVEIVLR